MDASPTPYAPFCGLGFQSDFGHLVRAPRDSVVIGDGRPRNGRPGMDKAKSVLEIDIEI